MDMSFGRLVEADGVRRSSVQGALIAGAIAGSCLAAIPAGLLERAVSSLGLSEIAPALAPPIGWSARIALILAGVAVAALLGARGGERGSVGHGQAGRKGMNMGWTQNLGLHHLVRLARGEGAAPRESATPARRSAEDKARDLLARRRADLHPDAPPRAPLSASRDLPQIVELKLVEPTAALPVDEPLAPAATPIRDTTDQDRPRPLPRSPEPLSGSDLSWVRSLLDDDRASDMAPLEGVVAEAPVAAPTVSTSTDYAEDASLMAMLDRFEQGVANRVALRDSADAQQRLNATLADDVGPAPCVDVQAANDVDVNDVDMDETLNAALETLRKLSAKANGR